MCNHTNTTGQEHMGYKVKYAVTKANSRKYSHTNLGKSEWVFMEESVFEFSLKGLTGFEGKGENKVRCTF